MPIFRRASRSSLGERAVISLPSTTTVPLVGRSSRLMHRTRVDLPAPEKPIMPKISPSWIVSDTSRTARTIFSPEPKSLDTWVNSIKEGPS